MQGKGRNNGNGNKKQDVINKVEKVANITPSLLSFCKGSDSLFPYIQSTLLAGVDDPTVAILYNLVERREVAGILEWIVLNVASGQDRITKFEEELAMYPTAEPLEIEDLKSLRESLVEAHNVGQLTISVDSVQFDSIIGLMSFYKMKTSQVVTDESE